MGREASSEPGRPPAYGRQGPCRWRSKGQRAETARELTLGNEVPSPPPPPQLRPGLQELGVCRGTPGAPTRGLRTPSGSPDFRDASSRGRARLDLGLEGEDRPKEKLPGCGAEIPRFRGWADRRRLFQKLKGQGP
ncbi:unnamed protein product [Rangifer tarandus platyrhynchus]|uniref:Uncharacterized protein n=1 Tax=Rangifer tarandus platyrhynchus TaxID=3082113 RepID=A0ABN9A704_RANTA|nr:unnamed protein product [Rangifer tarandus platyrhynchus]